VINCKICDREFKNYNGLVSHIHGSYKLSSKDYYNKYLKKENEGICKCGNNTNFISISKGYRKHCSIKCSVNSKEIIEKRKQTCLERYGNENPSNNKEIIEKRKQTSIKNWGFDNPNKSKEVREKIKKTNLEKYEVEHPSQNKEIKEKIKHIYLNKSEEEKRLIQNKMKKTNLQKYGVECSLQNEEVKEKSRQTLLKNYNCENPTKNKEIIKKIKKTNLERYGVESPIQNKEIKDKTKRTNLERYGVDNPSKSKEIREKQKNTVIEKFIPVLNNLLKGNNLELLSNYNHCRDSIKLKCKTCNNIFDSNYFNLYQDCGKCPKCFPKNKSNYEIELSDFIKSIESSEIIENNREIIKPYELDIFIPSKNMAIEFNGLYYHSEQFKIDKNYHLNKTELCESKNIQLIHIFEDEWIFKQDIVKSRLRQMLGINNSERIHARKCEIKEISPKIKNKFLNKYHIQGEDKSNIKLGAFYSNELISVMTFSKGNISKGSKNIEGVYELSRFCSNNNYQVPGIASKLLSYFKRNYSWKEIYSYADHRWSEGNLYYKIGFELEHITKPNYFYINGLNRIHRFNLRKKPDEPKDIPEWILRQKEGYFRIWDCGHYKFIMIK